MNTTEKLLDWYKSISPWKPIESAPKDGTQILAFDGQDFRVAWWKENGEWSQWLWQEFHQDGTPEDWRTVAVIDPTHWMSLPSPPQFYSEKPQDETQNPSKDTSLNTNV